MRIRISVDGVVRDEREIDREVVIGRSERADVAIDDEEISSRHLAIRPRGRGLEAEDLDSTNGTVLDGSERLRPGHPVAFARGNKLALGRTLVEVIAVAADGMSSEFGSTAAKTVAAEREQGHTGLVAIARFQAAGARLVITAEHDRRSVPLTEMEVTVGRDAKTCQIAVPHESISGRHAAIRYANGRFEVRDLDSSNGTFVAGARVSGWTALPPHAPVTFGTVDCLFTTRPPSGGDTQDPLAGALVQHVVAQGRATRHQGAEVLAAHRDEDRDVGELLVERGFLTPAQWCELHRQREAIAAIAPRSPAGGPSKWPFRIVVLLLTAAVATVIYLVTR